MGKVFALLCLITLSFLMAWCYMGETAFYQAAPYWGHASTAVGPSDTLSDSQRRDFAVANQAIKWGANVDTLLAISHIENWTGVPDAWSPNGCCIGIMQVNLSHFGKFHTECGGSDLIDIRINACYGVLLWLDHLEVCQGDGECALRGYVGQEDNVMAGDRYVDGITELLEVLPDG